MNKLKLIAILFLVGLAVYANSIPNSFVWDDNNLIVNNPDIKEITPGNIKKIFTNDLVYFVERSNFYRPLQSISYMLDYRIWGDTPGGYRSTNILFHTINGILIFIILSTLLRNNLASFFGALFFIIHPVNTSAVSYIAGRADILGLMFILFSWLFVLKFKDSKTFLNAFLALFAFILALLSKEVCVIFPIFVFVFLFGTQDWKISGKDKRFLLVFNMTGLLYLISRLTILKFAPLATQAVNIPSLYRRLLTVPSLVLSYVRFILLPYDLRMDRDFPIHTHIFQPAVILSVVGLIIIFLLFRKAIKREKILMLGIAWFFLLLLPSLNVIVPLNAPISEHWLYIAFPGVSMVIGYGISELLGKYTFKKLIYTGIIAIFALYASVTVYINTHWKNEESLFKYISKYKNINLRAYYNLGRNYMESAKYEEAIGEFKKALKENPEHYQALLQMALAHANIKDFDSAFTYFKKAVKIEPKRSITSLLFAQELNDLGKYDGAIKLYKSEINRNPKNAALYNGLGIAYANKELYDKAEEAWEKGLALQPNSEEIKKNLGKLYQLTGKAALARHIENVNKYASKGNYELAIEECKKGLEIDSENLTLHNNLGVLYGLLGQNEDAVEEFKIVISLDPRETGAYKNIAIIYSNDPKKYKEAIDYFREYLKSQPPAEERDLIEKSIEDLEKKLP